MKFFKKNTSINDESDPMKLPPLDLDIEEETASSSEIMDEPASEIFDQEVMQEEGMSRSLLFNKLLEEINDPGRKPYYTEKLLNKDLVSEMKTHWEKEKFNVITDTEGRKVEDKIREKIYSLKELEKEWQEHKLAIITREEKIRLEELELKKMLKEFHELCKRHSKAN